LLALAIFCVAVYLGRSWVLRAAARFLDVSESATATDYVMVMGGNLESRPFAAAAFLNAGLARKAVVARFQLWGDALDGVAAPEQEAIRSLLVSLGVSPDAIVIMDTVCKSTFDEAQALAEFLQSQPQRTVTVVTSRYHTRRVRSIFRKTFGSRAACLRFLGTPTDGFDETNWWHFESGTTTYLNEYFKLAFYLVRY
jgi:uncharacterized SAM-binding protein YcdF (DUF218 family)